MKGALGIVAVALFAYLGKAYLDGFLEAREAAREFSTAEKEWQEQIAASGIPAYWILGSKGYGFEVRDGETSLNDGGIVERKLAFSTRSSLLEVMSAYRDLAEQERWDVVRTKDANRLIAGTPAGGQVLVTASAGPDRTSVAIFYTIPR